MMSKGKKKILLLVGGGTGRLEPFRKEADELDLDLQISSFSQLRYLTGDKDFTLEVDGKEIESFDLIYIRLAGRRQEDASLLANHAKQKGIRLVDRIFEQSPAIRLPLAKSLETKLLVKAGIPVPKTLFASLKTVRQEAPRVFGFPFVIKGTYGKQGHAVWSPRNPEELEKIMEELREKEKRGGRFLAQEFIKASQRNRVLVVGGKAIAAITRPARWRRRLTKKVAGEYPPGKKGGLKPIPREDTELAISAAAALGIDIAGVDIIHEDKTGKPWVLEVNSAPRWQAIKQDTGVNVEQEILMFLKTLL